MNRKLRVLHVLNTDRFSGAENVVCQIIAMFRDGSEFDMAYASPDGSIRDALAERNIRFFPMAALTKKELRRVLGDYAPDIVHAHDVRATVLAAMTGGKAVLVSTMHVNDVSMRTLNIKALLYALAARRMRHIFWVSGSCLEQYRLRRLVAPKSSVLMNVIDRAALLKKMRTDPNDYDYDVVYVGRLSEQKNPLRLMDVLGLAASKKPGLRAAVIGDGELTDAAKAKAGELGIVRNVSFHGFVGNPYKILHDAKVMVMTSAWEGTPMVALEAMALGVPIVSTPTDGMRDLVRDGETGFLSDDDTLLADRLVRLVDDAALRRRLSAAAERRFSDIADIGSYRDKLRAAYIG